MAAPPISFNSKEVGGAGTLAKQTVVSLNYSDSHSQTHCKYDDNVKKNQAIHWNLCCYADFWFVSADMHKRGSAMIKVH